MMRSPRLFRMAALLCGLLPGAFAFAVNPSLSAITPYGFQRGTELDVSFTGARLSDAQELMFYSPGLKVVELKAEKDNLVKAKLAVAADCRLGIHAVRVRTATGVSNLRTFTIGALPEVKEVEPNSDFNAPQTVPLGSTVSGVVQNEDVDHYVVEAKKGDRITAELEGLRLGYTFFDPYLAILDSKRFELSRSDDASLLRQDCLCAVVAPEDGKYIVQVRESAYGGNGSCKYRLHIGKFPRPRVTVPSGGKPGEKLTVQWIGDPAGDRSEEVTLPGEKNLQHGLFAKDEHGIAPSPNLFRVVDLTNAIEVEPNDQRTQATAAVAPGAYNGVIEKPGDIDFFKFTAKKGQQMDIRVYARKSLRSPLDSVINIYRANGSRVTGNDDSGGPDSYFRFNPPADEEYTLSITDHLKSGGPTYAYRIEAAPIQRALTLSLPEKTRYVSTTLSVPRGNRTALMVNAARASWGGELNVSVEGMPKGLTLQTVTMPANRTTVPVLFSAAADAPLAGALTDLVGRPVDEKIGVVGHLKQRTMLVRGQNNRDVWGHDADRMAVVVAEESPFSIEIVQPKAPIARRGSMRLKVVAKRKEGFTAAIAIRMLYNPPGIGSSGSISIPAGKNEATIPLTANSGASIQSWPIIVTGRATVGNGPVEVASQMAELKVSDSYVNLAFEKAAAEQGKETEVIVNITKKVDFKTDAQFQLVGLPANTSTPAEPVNVKADAEQIVFPVTVTEKARPGVYKSLVCKVTVMENGEPVLHTLGTGELRVDKPLPPPKKPTKPAPKPAVAAAKPKPKPPTAAPMKRLSRLEMLRLKRKEALGASLNDE